MSNKTDLYRPAIELKSGLRLYLNSDWRKYALITDAGQAKLLVEERLPVIVEDLVNEYLSLNHKDDRKMRKSLLKSERKVTVDDIERVFYEKAFTVKEEQ